MCTTVRGCIETFLSLSDCQLADERMVKQCIQRRQPYKYEKVALLIAQNPQIETHVISDTVHCNNVPDMISHANDKLAKYGLVIINSRPRRADRQSWFWYMIKKP